jgi:hypothetical protein
LRVPAAFVCKLQHNAEVGETPASGSHQCVLTALLFQEEGKHLEDASFRLKRSGFLPYEVCSGSKSILKTSATVLTAGLTCHEIGCKYCRESEVKAIS